MNNKDITLGALIRQAREDMRPYMSQLNLAQEMGFKNGTMICRWEKDQRRPGTRNLTKLCKILNKPMGYFFPNEDLTNTPGDIKLPALLSIFKRQLDDAEERYELQIRNQKLRELPVMIIETKVPKSPTLITTQKTITVPESELISASKTEFKDPFAIEVTTDLGLEFDIHIGDFVLMEPNPQQIDGELYLITYQGQMMYRNIIWDPPSLFDRRGIQTPFQKKGLIMSGRVIKVIRSSEPYRYKPQP